MNEYIEYTEYMYLSLYIVLKSPTLMSRPIIVFDNILVSLALYIEFCLSRLTILFVRLYFKNRIIIKYIPR